MTQRKFRYLNSNTNDLYAYKVQEQDRCYYEFYHNYSLVGEAPPVVVENSDDWQEITEPELVEGRWYKDCFLMGRWDGAFVGDNEIKLNDAVRLPDYSPLTSLKTGPVGIFNLEDCTQNQIHQALDAIRVKKGLVEGVKVKSLRNGHLGTIKHVWDYQAKGDRLYGMTDNGILCIYDEGNWASKVEEPVLVTQDGYEITSPFEQLWLADLADYEVYPIHLDEEAIESQDYVFYEFSNALGYIENHKPRYSKADLEFLENEVFEAFNKIQNLGQSKQTNYNQ